MAVKKRGGLGKGIDALIPSSKASTNTPNEADNHEKNTKKPEPKVVEKIVKVPVEKIVEKIVEVPVEKIVEKTVEVPVDRLVEKIVEVPVDRVVEKIVEVPVDRVVEKVVEVPVDRVVEKIVEVNNAETMVDIDEIEPNRKQPRNYFDEDALQELSDSIRQFGVIQPLIVQKEENYYTIIAGERRWRAARLAGLTQVPVIIKDYSPREMVEIALIENIQREDLNPIEEAAAFQRLINEFGLKQDEAAERVSKSRSAVTNALRLLKLDERVKQMIIDDMITSGHGRALLAIEDQNLQYTLANKIFDYKMSVRETERLVKSTVNGSKKHVSATSGQTALAYKSLEEKIKSIVGTKVSIKTKNDKKGKIEIEYYSVDELERIMDLFESMK